ncbi:hypothetical protein GDN83_10340 [Gordonia jinghuaiqii]|uniref:DUF2267 domain-containing protein n=1 Tax=Gordonia jinghuaiqii TaxID=2758710 RepID=A0A7D7LT70_9ACTN|nr:hypothetical protein [Gordonia jinghuaiqii]MCR5978123.1 hypothetical protein [Gordonia jinghuaiqii]QMT01417.1 hypothetical protein H1R19_21795 [Gordonia jinghuaiqii]
MAAEQEAERIGGLRIVAEHGLPATLIEHGENRFDQLAGELSMEYRGFTITRDTTLQMSPRGDLETVWGSDDTADEVIVFVTEMPRLYKPRGVENNDDRHPRNRVVLAELDRESRAAVISLPALGPLPRRRLRQLIETVVRAIIGDVSMNEFERRRGLVVERDGNTEYVLAQGYVRRLRLTAGMVRGNRPWRLIPTLTGMTAAAAAAASFGIFFSTIWSMANALSAWRLAAISVLSMVLASVWLVANNRLWERTAETAKQRARLYNMATVCTVAFSAVVLYAGLFAATFVAALIVIDESFLAEQLGHPVGLHHYVYLSWMATSMGMFAGALGSSADSHDDVLRATYGYRERMRRQASDATGWSDSSEVA